MWAVREDIGDNVDYVNEMRRRNEKGLRETLEEVAEWERKQASWQILCSEGDRLEVMVTSDPPRPGCLGCTVPSPGT